MTEDEWLACEETRLLSNDGETYPVLASPPENLNPSASMPLSPSFALNFSASHRSRRRFLAGRRGAVHRGAGADPG